MDKRKITIFPGIRNYSLSHSQPIHPSIRSSLTISLGGLGGKQRLVQVFWRRRRPRIVSWRVNWAKTIEPKYVWGRVCCTFLLNIHLRLPLWPQLWHDTRYQSIQTVVNKNRVYVFTVRRHHLGKFAGVKIITWISTVIWSFSPTCILLLGMHCARSLPFLPHVHHTVVKVSQKSKRVKQVIFKERFSIILSFSMWRHFTPKKAFQKVIF